MSDLVLISLASGLAGFVDAIVGGGGLVLVPALFAVYPHTPPATLLGTNKATSVWGTAWATRQFARRVSMPWRTLLPAALVAMLASWCGAQLVTQVSPAHLRRMLPLVLLAVLGYTLWRKDLGRVHAPRLDPAAERRAAIAIAAVIGAYDGFFGPGTGSFFVFLFVRWLGYDFLHASASAKLLNTATNAAALAGLAWHGHVWWPLAAWLALVNVAGSTLGTRLALRRGTGFVRGVFLVVVGALILRTGYDAFVLAR